MSALTSLLVRDGVVPVRKIEEALQRQVMSGGDIETVLLEMNAVSENALSAYLAAVYDVRPASRETVMTVDPEVIALVPGDVAIEHRLIPLRVEGRTLFVAVHAPLGGDDVERLGFLLGFEIVSQVACEVRVAAGLAHHYGAELTPRLVRLVSRVHGRPAGAVPDVSRAAGGLGAHLSDLPDKTATADAVAQPRYTRSGNMILEPAPPELEPASSTRHTLPVGVGPTDEPADSGRLTDPGGVMAPPEPSSIAALLKKHRGPITLKAGERLLRQATDRDQIIAVFFAFARQFFDYTALFVVHDLVADGREAYGLGAPTSQVRALSIPLDRPGAFAEALRTLTPQVRRLDQTETDRDVSVGLRRPASPTAMVMPIAIRQRLVLILYGDRDGEEFDLGSALELVRFGPRVVEAFEQLIIRKKRSGYTSSPPAEPERAQRAELKAAAREAALRTPESPPLDRSSWKPGQRRITSPGFAPDSFTSDDSWTAVRASPQPIRVGHTPPESTPRSAEGDEGASAVPAAAGSKDSPARARRKPRRPPSAILGIPRRAPPPPPSDDVEVSQVGLDDEDDLDLLYGDEEGYDVELTVDGDDDEDDEILIFAGDDDDEDDGAKDAADEEPDPDVQGAAGAADEDAEGTAARGDAGDGEARGDADDAGDGWSRDTDDEDEPDHYDPDPDPDTARREARTDPPRAASTYSIKGAPVDVIRTGRRPSKRPSKPAEERLDRKRTPRERPPLRRSDRPVPSEGAPAAAAARSEPPTGLDASTRSVIVDMGHQVHDQVNDLLAATRPDEEERLAAGLLALGEVALPVLAQAFPGPLRWRREQRGKVPSAGEISPVMRALVAFGPRAASYVAALLSSAHPDVRFYAAVVASEIVSPELVDAVAERIHDEDKGVRRIAVQLLPRFAAFRGFAEIRTVIRRTARIRGKLPERREHAIDAVAELRDVEMVPKLIELLREDDERLVGRVHAALVKISSTDFGRSHRKWAAWWDRNRGRHRVEWLIDGLVHADEALRRQASEELKRITQEYYGYHAGSPRRDRELIANKYRQWWQSEGQRRFA